MDPATMDYAGISPYNSNFNNPMSFADPDGDDPFWTWLQYAFGFGQGGMPAIQLDGVTVYGSRLSNGSFDGILRSFETNGFSRITVAAAASRSNYNLNAAQWEKAIKAAYEPMRRIDLPEVTISANRLIDGFPASQRVYAPYEWSSQAFADAMESQRKSFKFVTHYFAPAVTAFAFGGLEGIGLSGARIVGKQAIEAMLEEAAKQGVEEALVQVNRRVGNAFRDELARLLEQMGREVTTEVYKRTPFGKRYVDIQVKYKGRLSGIETKTGQSRYNTLQRLKDLWLEKVEGYPINLVRKPNNW